MASVFDIAAKFTAIDKMTAPIKKMQAGVTGFAQKSSNVIHRVDRGFIRLGRSIRNVAGQFGLFLGGAALFFAIRSSIGLIADYQQANANLASILSVNVSQTQALQKSSKELGASTKFTATQVTQLQTEYAKLGFVQSEILGVTEATLNLAAATNTELPQAAKQVGAALRAYQLDAREATRVTDVFSALTSKSGVDMEFLAVSMSKVAPVAKKLNFDIEATSALFGKLADAGFESSIAAVSTRNIMLKLADPASKLSKAFGKPVRSIEQFVTQLKGVSAIDLGKALELTDVRSVAAFATFIDQADSLMKLNNDLKGSSGFAELMSMRQMDTLTGSMYNLTSAWQGLLLSIDDGTGSFIRTLRTIIDVTTAILRMASGTDDATKPVKSMSNMMLTLEGQLAFAKQAAARYEHKIQGLAETTLKVLNVTKYLIGTYLALKVIILVVRTAYAAYSIGLGIATALQWTNTLAVKGNVLAMTAARVATVAATIATKAWGVALTIATGPIGWIIAAVVALGVAIFYIIKKWDEWGAAITIFMGPLGLMISGIMSVVTHWNSVIEAFKGGGIMEGMKAIGVVIVDTILKPLEQILGLAEKFTGLNLGFSTISGLRNNMLESIGETPTAQTAQDVQTVNPDVRREEVTVQRFEEFQKQQSELLIRDETGRAELSGNSGSSIKLQPSWL